MLVLSRKNQESVVVSSPEGGECLLKVSVIEIRGNRVKLGFQAADDVAILRSELWQGTPRNQPNSRDVAANEATGRWDDDGGGAGEGQPEAVNAVSGRGLS